MAIRYLILQFLDSCGMRQNFKQYFITPYGCRKYESLETLSGCKRAQ